MYSMLYFRSSKLIATEDGCSSQPKHVTALKPITQSVGNELLCIRQLNGKCTSFSLQH